MNKPATAPRPAPKPRNVKVRLKDNCFIFDYLQIVTCFDQVMRAVYDYTGEEEDELSFSAGDILYVVDSSDPDWWRARCKGQEGLVPSNMVENATSDGNTGPLHDAAKRGNIELLRECLSNRMPVNQADPAGNTALHWAARSGQLECLQELVGVVQIGMDKVNKLGDTPAMLAASHGHALCVEALLKVMSGSVQYLYY